VAIHWYEEAAGHGEAQAMYELGRLYLSKCGPDKDKAFTWFTIGERFRSAESRTEADKMRAAMAAVARQHAETAAAKWIKEHPGSDNEEDEEEKK
jgi:TPR repeat protein